MTVIPCYPKETKKEIARFLTNKARAEEREGRSGEEYYQLAHMFKHRIPDCTVESRLHKSYLDTPIHDPAEEPGDPHPSMQPGDISNDITMLTIMAKMDPRQQVGNVVRQVVEQQEYEGEGLPYLKVGKVEDPDSIDYTKKHYCHNFSEPVDNKYLCPETVYEEPEYPDKFHTIADIMYFEDDKVKGKWKKAGLVEQAGFLQATNPEAVKMKSQRPVVTEQGRAVVQPEQKVPEDVQKLTEEIQKEMPKPPPKKTRKPAGAKLAGCAVKTRTLAQRLRDYDRSKIEAELAGKKEQLETLKHTEDTTDDNEVLDQVQEEIPRIQREIKALSKQSISTLRTEFKELQEKCPGLVAEYHPSLGQHSNVLKLHYTANGLDVQSLVVRDDAQELYEEILKGGI